MKELMNTESSLSQEQQFLTLAAHWKHLGEFQHIDIWVPPPEMFNLFGLECGLWCQDF